MPDFNVTITKETAKYPRTIDSDYVCEACGRDCIKESHLYFAIEDAGYAMPSSIVVCIPCVKKAIGE